MAPRTALSTIYRPIDGLLWLVSRIGAVAMVAIVAITVYDVATRYFGVPKAFGLTSTKLQDAEWWTHTILFSTVIAYAYTRQAHVRIDLVRERLPERAQYIIEMIGIIAFLLPFSVIGGYYTYGYAMRSYTDSEGSTSTVGLDHIWIVKFFLLAMFVTLALAAISQLLKCFDGLAGNLPADEAERALGGGH